MARHMRLPELVGPTHALTRLPAEVGKSVTTWVPFYVVRGKQKTTKRP